MQTMNNKFQGGKDYGLLFFSHAVNIVFVGSWQIFVKILNQEPIISMVSSRANNIQKALNNMK